MGWFRSTDDADQEQAPSIEERLAAITPGVPGRCPACDGLGYIDSIDIAHRYQIQHCKDCQHRWEYLFDRDGAVVGLTELDGSGQPTARTRVRPLRAGSPALEPVPDLTPPPPAPEVLAEPDPVPAVRVELAEEVPHPVEADGTDETEGVDEVLDLRDPEPVPSSIDEMSPAEWLRHSLRR